jgi:hypothetical protein
MHDGMWRTATARGYRCVIPHRHELFFSPDQDQFVAHPAVAYRGCGMPRQAARDDFAGFHLVQGTKLIPQSFVRHVEQRVINRVDGDDIKVTPNQPQRLSVAGRQVCGNEFNGRIAVRHRLNHLFNRPAMPSKTQASILANCL